MNKARWILWAGAVAGALAMLAYGIAWRAAGQALGFGPIVCGFPSGGGDRHLSNLSGACDALAGALLGRASADILLPHRPSPRARLDAASTCEQRVFWVATSVGLFGVLVLLCAVGPGLLAVARRFDAHEFALQQFILTGVVANPKLWWCWLLGRHTDRIRAEACAQTQAKRAATSSDVAAPDAATSGDAAPDEATLLRA